MAFARESLYFYGAKNIATDDTSLQGGVVDPITKYAFDLIDGDVSLVKTVSGTINLQGNFVLDSGADQIVHLIGRNPDGDIVTDDIPMSGTLLVSGTTYFDRLYSASIPKLGVHATLTHAGHSGVITKLFPHLQNSGTTFQRPFLYAEGPSAGTKAMYEKVFMYNNSSETLFAIEIHESGNTDNVTFALGDQNDSLTTPNRLTAPSGIGPFNHLGKNIPHYYLPPGSAQSIWLRLNMDVDTDDNFIYTLICSGTATITF